MATIDLSKYGITGTTEIVYNPSYEVLFEEETKPGLEGYDKGQVTDLGCLLYTSGSSSPVAGGMARVSTCTRFKS